MTDKHIESGATVGGYEVPTLRVEVQFEDPSTLLVEVRGELDLATAPTLRQHLEPFATLPSIEVRRQKIIYRLAHLSFMDVAGLDGLLTAMDGHGPDTICIREPSPPVRRVFAIVGLESMIEDDGRGTSR